MHAAFGDDLPVKVGQFLQEPNILQESRTAWPCGHDVLVIDDRSTYPGGQFFFSFIDPLLSS